jgi:thioesterase domain-containing protein
MAQQLHAKGEEVEIVALLDSSAGDSGHGKADFLRDFLRDLPSWLVGSLQLSHAQWLSLIKLKISMTKAKLGGILHSSNEGPSQGNTPRLVKELGDVFGLSERHRRVARAQYQALKAYTPRVYPGKITLFRARMQPLFSSHAPDKGWRRLAAGGLDIKVIPGNHLGMLQEPHVEVLAGQLRACLDQAQDSGTTGAEKDRDERQDNTFYREVPRLV